MIVSSDLVNIKSAIGFTVFHPLKWDNLQRGFWQLQVMLRGNNNFTNVVHQPSRDLGYADNTRVESILNNKLEALVISNRVIELWCVLVQGDSNLRRWRDCARCQKELNIFNQSF